MLQRLVTYLSYRALSHVHVIHVQVGHMSPDLPVCHIHVPCVGVVGAYIHVHVQCHAARDTACNSHLVCVSQMTKGTLCCELTTRLSNNYSSSETTTDDMYHSNYQSVHPLFCTLYRLICTPTFKGILRHQGHLHVTSFPVYCAHCQIWLHSTYHLKLRVI